MTRRYQDGFDYLPAGSTHTNRLLQAAGYYFRGPGTAFNPNAPTFATLGRFGFGKRLSWATTIGTQAPQVNLVKPISPGLVFTTGFLGWAVHIDESTVVPFDFGLYDAVNDAAQFTVELGVNGVIRVYRGAAGGTPIGESHAGAYQYGEDWFLEIGGTIANSGGYAEVRVNTVPKIILPSEDTQTTAVAGFDAYQISARNIGLSQNFIASIDDHYMNDDAGAVNNTFAGNQRIKTQFTYGAGPSTQFSRVGAAATNWQAAQNTVLDDAGGYVHDGVVGELDLYAMEPILGAAPVSAVQYRMGIRQDDATQMVARRVAKFGATQVEGPDHYTNQTFTYYTDIEELNPDTGLGMTGTEVNAAYAGPKVEA